ncbi:T9SS type A sorting domain-containing protein [Rurimicrobium arvi]|uniref:T9SS type A sorting domain-containing protein n=1 Tax=Rurimicrobium arvi TaxID=2049916 RepID=UPI0031D91D1B
MHLFCISQVWAQRPDKMPVRSRSELFTFYSNDIANRPQGADIASKGIINIAGVNPEFTNSTDLGGSTAFIIRSFRNDDRFCVCMTGHQVKTLSGGIIPPVPGYIYLNNNIRMDYLGEDSASHGTNYVRINNYSSSFLSHAELVEHYLDIPINQDAALLLIDKSWFPSENFAALGYDFSPVNEQAGGNHYVLSHPWDYPMRLSDYGIFQEGDEHSVDISANLPFACGAGSSGAPLLSRPSGATVNALVKGILSSGVDPVSVREYAADGVPRFYSYSTEARYTRISLLESAIRKHCWNKQDSAEISRSGMYKQTVLVSNAKPALKQNQSLNNVADVSGSAAAKTESSTDKRVTITKISANNCSVGGFTLPVTYPGGTATWRVVIAANQVDVNAGFSYAASGTSELDLTTIETYTRSATSRTADAADTASNLSDSSFFATPGFKLYPNPSPDGVFFLELPATEQPITYTGSIINADGKLVQQLNRMQSGQKVSFRLACVPQGIYFLNLYVPDGRIVFTVKIFT